MQTLANIVIGAFLAGASLGPSVWSEVAWVDARLSQAVLMLAGAQEADSPLDHAVAKARAALPSLPSRAR